MKSIFHFIHSILLGYGQFLCSVVGFTIVPSAIGIFLAIIIPNIRRSSNSSKGLLFALLLFSLIIVLHSYCIFLAMKNKRSPKGLFDQVSPFLISRKGPEIFVSFQKPITDWTEAEMGAYQNRLHEEIKETLSNDDYNTFQERHKYPNEYMILLLRIRQEISEYYHVNFEEIELAHYHGDQTAFLFRAKIKHKPPYLFRGFQIRIDYDERQRIA